MNQNQIKLIKQITDEMILLWKTLVCTDKYEDIINEDDGEYMNIVISIISSLLVTTLNSWINAVEKDPIECDTMFKSLLFIIASKANEARDNHYKQKDMH